jgi:hypothetical protein
VPCGRGWANGTRPCEPGGSIVDYLGLDWFGGLISGSEQIYNGFEANCHQRLCAAVTAGVRDLVAAASRRSNAPAAGVVVGLGGGGMLYRTGGQHHQFCNSRGLIRGWALSRLEPPPASLAPENTCLGSAAPACAAGMRLRVRGVPRAPDCRASWALLCNLWFITPAWDCCGEASQQAFAGGVQACSPVLWQQGWRRAAGQWRACVL